MTVDAPFLTLTIEGCAYRLTLGRDGGACWCDLTKMGQVRRRETWRVSLTAGELRCNCPARQFGDVKCKHVLAIAAVGLADLPAWQRAG